MPFTKYSRVKGRRSRGFRSIKDLPEEDDTADLGKGIGEMIYEWKQSLGIEERKRHTDVHQYIIDGNSLLS